MNTRGGLNRRSGTLNRRTTLNSRRTTLNRRSALMMTPVRIVRGAFRREVFGY
jgi:hypothetical protein